MSIVLHLLFGLIIGFVGVIPPGLLNLTAAKISVKQTRKAAVMFALGASVVVIAQVYVGVFFSKLLNDNPETLLLLEQFAAIAFIGLSIFFFIRAMLDTGSPEVKKIDKSPIKLFGQGIILSVLNIFPIPFYIGFSSFLASRGLFKFSYPMAHLFILGAALGTFLMLLAYIKYVKKFAFDSNTFARKINYVLGGLTLFIAVFTIYRIYG
ncbi:threonine/homoserine/homoserine lactone efflux protein [Nonlabens dokdonensis]|jgi:threonine/homoserine/homoserine lactone efflux protein|uniref:Lysine exporter protein (LYSE/YGGA) n=2 Tax=Nonlabens dokdonensis TaxID=328515 RepID=L7WBA4_NONDD|nr:LysE family transporter [Nonlabens dokdonensis]AGC76178.1 lysine exporter protein (LYSE/YGGA) [Nonlabens dokdonensis DSW-6]PZX43846.1 threonine/homoserine/homoserine lactone efflux protein [Nonlabens dokdonensis]